ncbi:hypothetical protein HK101_002163 [Irineochytrium annulatum]|nr:hypothetical protein HK101_002163 [Irineochytrium annulatum]
MRGLAHPNKEIRGRARDAFLFKLTNELLDIDDVVQDPTLVPDVFTLAESPESESRLSALQILEILSNHPRGCHAIGEQPDGAERILRLVSDPFSSAETVETARAVVSRCFDRATRSPLHRPRNLRPSAPVPLPMRARSASPSRGWDFPEDQPVFQHLPNGIQSYELIHLSPIDEDTILKFTNMLSEPIPTEPERQLFDIILSDFGASIFLQRSHLLRAILMGFEAQSVERCTQSISYTKDLISELTKVFRYVLDNPSQHHPSTPISNTPNVSVNTRASETRENGSHEHGISFPFACHEIFHAGLKCLQYFHAFYDVLKILHRVLPLLLLHLDIIGEKSENAAPLDVVAFEYLRPLLNVISELGDGFERGDEFRSEVVVLTVCEYAWALSQVIKGSPLLLRKVVSYLCTSRTPNSFPRTLCTTIVTRKCPDLNILIFAILRANRPWVQLQLLEEIRGRQVSDGVCDGDVECVDCVAYCLVELTAQKGQLEIAEMAKAIVLAVVTTETISQHVLIAYITWLQLFAMNDACGSLLQVALERGMRREDTSALLSIGIRGLFHRNDRIREDSMNLLLKICPSWSNMIQNVDSPSSVAVFSKITLATLSTDARSAKFKIVRQVSDIDKVVDSLHTTLGLNAVVLEGVIELAAQISDEAFRVKSAELGMLDALSSSLVNLAAEWRNHKPELCAALRVCRVLIEGNDELCLCMLAETAKLRELAKYLIVPEQSIRLECAKLLFPVLFSTSVLLRDSDGRILEQSYSSRVKYLTSVVRSYHCYNTANTVSIDITPDVALQRDHVGLIWEVLKNYRRLQRGVGCSNGPGKIEQDVLFNYSALRTASSHGELGAALNFFEQTCITTEDFARFVELDQTLVFQRFFSVAPASPEDETIFARVLRFASNLIANSSWFDAFARVFTASFQNILLAILQENYTHLHGEGHLCYEIIRFILMWFKTLSGNDLAFLVKHSKCVEVLTEYTNFAFSVETKASRNQLCRLNCLRCLLIIVSLPQLVSIASGEALCDLIRLFVEVLGFSQQNYANATDGNSFTYKDRSFYRIVGQSLRNASRSVVVVQSSSTRFSIWGDHWLFEGEIDWLLLMMNDDEKLMQKYALGILGNLILLRGSYACVLAKIPYFFDMSFSFILDFAKEDFLRKEAILIINNFLITFCQDNKITPLELLPDRNDDNDCVDGNDEHRNESTNPMATILQLIDNCGFFDRIRDTLICDRSMVAYRCAMTELLLNLFILTPDVIYRHLIDSSAWQVLIDYLVDSADPYEITKTSALSANLVRNQFKKIYGCYMERIRNNVFNIVLFAVYEKPQCRLHAIENTSLMQHIKVVIGESAREELSMIPNSLMALMTVFGEILGQCANSHVFDLYEYMTTDKTGEDLFRLIYASLRCDGVEQKIACALLAKLLCLHFGEILKIGVDETLARPLAEDESFTLGVAFTEFLVNKLTDMHLITDVIFLESLRLSLQCLLGRCGFAKSHALSVNLPEHLIATASLILKSQDKLEDPFLTKLHVTLCVLRHLLAGSVDIKIVLGQQNLLLILYDILQLQETEDRILIETFGCMRNLLANLLEPERLSLKTRPNDNIPECVFRIIKKTMNNDDVFSSGLEVLSVLALHADSRMLLLKANIFHESLFVLSKVLNRKESLKTESLLKFLRNLTYTSDCQSLAIRAPGNMAIPKDNRAYFIADGKML